MATNEDEDYSPPIFCPTCGFRLKVNADQVDEEFFFCDECVVNVYSGDVLTREHEYCDSCYKRVEVGRLKIGYMRRNTDLRDSGSGYEMGMLCPRCRTFDPAM